MLNATAEELAKEQQQQHLLTNGVVPQPFINNINMRNHNNIQTANNHLKYQQNQARPTGNGIPPAPAHFRHGPQTTLVPPQPS